MNVRSLLREEIKSQIEALDKLEFGSEQYRIAVEGLAKLLSKYNEMEQMDLEYQDKYESRQEEIKIKKEENDLKRMQIKEEKFDHWVKNGLTLLTFGGTAALAVWGTLSSFKFEETGTVTTLMGRGWVNKLLPKMMK